jgi:chromosome segregation ATPase
MFASSANMQASETTATGSTNPAEKLALEN